MNGSSPGCVSSHFENMVIEGKVKLCPPSQRPHRRGMAEKEDGDMLTASLTVKDANTALSERLSTAQERSWELFIIDRLELGMTTGPDNATLTMNEHNGDMHPFSLAEKLTSITEPCQWYSDDNSSPGIPRRAVGDVERHGAPRRIASTGSRPICRTLHRSRGSPTSASARRRGVFGDPRSCCHGPESTSRVLLDTFFNRGCRWCLSCGRAAPSGGLQGVI